MGVVEVVKVPSEHNEQVWLFEWAKAMKAQYPALGLMFAIPNGGKRHIGTARKLKAEGVKAGVPDIFLPHAAGDWLGLFLELKRLKGGKMSETQQNWTRKLREAGYRVETCKGWVEASEAILAYLRTKGGR